MKIITINNKKESKLLRRETRIVDINSLKKGATRQLIEELRVIMKKDAGIGLSANQVGLDLRLFIAEVPADRGRNNKFYAIFNPEIIKKSAETINLEEGCLSIPGIFGLVARPEKITLIGFDVNGKKIKIKAWGLLARVFQHEVDHLNGILFTQKAKELKKASTQ